MNVKDILDLTQNEKIRIKRRSARTLYGLSKKYECSIDFKDESYKNILFGNKDEIEAYINEYNDEIKSFYIHLQRNPILLFRKISDNFVNYSPSRRNINPQYKNNDGRIFLSIVVRDENFPELPISKRLAYSRDVFNEDSWHIMFGRDEDKNYKLLKLHNFEIVGTITFMEEFNCDNWLDDLKNISKFFPEILNVKL